MCLQWLYTILSSSKNEISINNTGSTTKKNSITILDYGCGSGILGIGACALGRYYDQTKDVSNNNDVIQVQAIGIDIDIDAVRIANTNAILNNHLPMKCYLPTLDEDDDESRSILMKSTTRKAAPVVATTTTVDLDDEDDYYYDEVLPKTLQETKYPICVANILALPLVYLAPTLAEMVQSPGGLIGLSGILSQQSTLIIDAYSLYFTNVTITHQIDDWIFLSGIRK